MRIARSLALVIMALLVLSSPAMAQKAKFAVLEGAQLDKYPSLDARKRLTNHQVTDMKLHLEKVGKPVVVLNYHGEAVDKDGRYMLETLNPETLVYKDELGNLRYKEDCSNRLIEIANQALVRGITSSIKVDPSKPVVPYFPATSTPPQRSLWSKFTDGIKNLVNFLRPFAEGLGWVFLLIFAVLMLAALYEWARHGRGGHGNYGPLPVASPQPASAPAAQPQHIAQPVSAVPAPAPATAEAEPVTDPTGNSTRSRLQYHPQNGANPAMVRTNGNITVHSVEHSGDEHVIRYRLS